MASISQSMKLPSMESEYVDSYRPAYENNQYYGKLFTGTLKSFKTYNN
jgi:hypothetical protein